MDDSINFLGDDGIPIGFGMALAQNSNVMEYFSGLAEPERQAITNGARNIRSKDEMEMYVNNITKRRQ